MRGEESTIDVDVMCTDCLKQAKWGDHARPPQKKATVRIARRSNFRCSTSQPPSKMTGIEFAGTNLAPPGFPRTKMPVT